MRALYEVVMIDGDCLSEICSIGLYETEELANAAIKKEKLNYSNHMIFTIETKYLRS